MLQEFQSEICVPLGFMSVKRIAYRVLRLECPGGNLFMPLRTRLYLFVIKSEKYPKVEISNNFSFKRVFL